MRLVFTVFCLVLCAVGTWPTSPEYNWNLNRRVLAMDLTAAITGGRGFYIGELQRQDCEECRKERKHQREL
jgi:hypothetical protein